jgi:O-methyltransferase involved in polyketide biosynthesis
MTEKQTSSTAIFTTMLRAVHQTTDSAPKILDDPVSVILAKQFERSAALVAFGALPQPLLRMTRSALILRNRFAEDVLQEVVSYGKCQYVILGAGFDTFAYRQPPWAQTTPIFEVDHPVTQESKRIVLIDAKIALPENLFCGTLWLKPHLSLAFPQYSLGLALPSTSPKQQSNQPSNSFNHCRGRVQLYFLSSRQIKF